MRLEKIYQIIDNQQGKVSRLELMNKRILIEESLA